MTTTVTPPARTLRPPRKARSNGQWALDGRKPLNDNEAFKQDGDPLAVRDRIVNIYGPGGYESIAPDDLNGRFRWWGLYTQRKQGIDGGRTAQLDASELSDRYFLQRVRLDGGSLSREQLRVLGWVSNDFARGTADITDRQNIQLHWVEIDNVPELWQRLESVGLTTVEGCGDTPRGFLVSPVAGIAKDEVIDPTPLARAIKDTYLGDPELANLPRKFKTAITGSPSLDILHEINDVSFVGVNHPELGPGYDLWVAGALSTAPRLGQRLGAFVTPEDVLDVWYGVIRIFRDYGYRRLRNKARLKFLMAEWGPEKFRQVLQDDYLGRALPDGPAPEEPSGDSDHIGVHEQKDGRFWVGAKPPVGRLSGDVLLGLADLAERVGSNRVRTTPLQNLLLLDVPAEKVDDAVAGHAHQAQDPVVDATEGLRALLGMRGGQHRHLLSGGGHRQEDGHAHRRDGGAAVPHEDAAVLGQGDVLGRQGDGDAARPPLVSAVQRQLVGGNGDGELGDAPRLEVVTQWDREGVGQSRLVGPGQPLAQAPTRGLRGSLHPRHQVRPGDGLSGSVGDGAGQVEVLVASEHLGGQGVDAHSHLVGGLLARCRGR